MCHAATILSPSDAAMRAEDQYHMDDAPLRPAAGFVLGIAISGALWVAAGLVVWYIA